MSDHLTPEQLAQIRDRADKATEGPWEVQTGDWAAISTGPDSVIHAYCKTEDCECGGDAEVSISLEDEVFIANARQDVPALLAHIDAQAATIQRVRDLHTEDKGYGQPNLCKDCLVTYPCPTINTLNEDNQ